VTSANDEPCIGIAHDEAINPRHDDAAGEAWLHGVFRYMLYRSPPAST
jgi:hypothetical protein